MGFILDKKSVIIGISVSVILLILTNVIIQSINPNAAPLYPLLFVGFIIGLIISLIGKTARMKDGLLLSLIVWSATSAIGILVFLISGFTYPYHSYGDMISRTFTIIVGSLMTMNLLTPLTLVIGTFAGTTINKKRGVALSKTEPHREIQIKRMDMIVTTLFSLPAFSLYFVAFFLSGYYSEYGNVLIYGYIIVGMISGLLASFVNKFESLADGILTFISTWLIVIIMGFFVLLFSSDSLFLLILTFPFVLGGSLGVIIYRISKMLRKNSETKIKDSPARI